MVDYNENTDPPVDSGGITPPADDLPIGDEDFTIDSQFERAGGAIRPAKFNRITLAMFGLFGAGIVLVAFLAFRGGPTKASAGQNAAEKKVDTFIARSEADRKRLAADAKDVKKTVQAFYDYAERHQVPLEQLKVNPFIFGAEAKDTSFTPVDPTDVVSVQERKSLESEFKRLKLQSVMMGPRGGTAIINMNFVTEGRKVGRFIVAKIEQQQVTLKADGLQFTLKLAK